MLILEITQCIYLGNVYARNSTMQKIGSFVLQQARSYAYRIVGCLLIYLYVATWDEGVIAFCDCHDEESYKFYPISGFRRHSCVHAHHTHVMRFPLIFRYIRSAHL